MCIRDSGNAMTKPTGATRNGIEREPPETNPEITGPRATPMPIVDSKTPAPLPFLADSALAISST